MREYMRIVRCCTTKRRAARAMWHTALHRVRAIRQTEKAEKRQQDAADLAEASRLRLGKRVVGIEGGYSEARSYQRGNDARGGGDADGERQRVVWRKSGAAEVGLVMLRRVEGRIPMLGRVPWEAPPMLGRVPWEAPKDGQTEGDDGIT